MNMTEHVWHQRGYRSITGGELVRVGSRAWGAEVEIGDIGIALERWWEETPAPWPINRGTMIRCLFGRGEVSLPENCLEVEVVGKVCV
jgi:hypothetical protein